MRASDCVELGYVSKAHGLKGDIKVRFDVQDIQDYQKLKSVYLCDKQDVLTSFDIGRIQIINTNEALIHLKHVNYRDEAEALRGSKVMIPLADLPDLPEDKFYFFEIEGFTVIDKELGTLGVVKNVLDMPASPVVVMLYQEKEVLLPMTKEFVIRADKEAKQLHTDLPKGLLETYLS